MKKGSGEHPAVEQFRKKALSYDETTLPRLEQIRERVEKASSSSPPESSSKGAVIVVTVHASGANQGRLPADVARLASQLVEELRVIGHTITFASIAHGGDDIVIDRGQGGPTP